MENLNYLDVALGCVVILSALIGLTRGLIKEVLSLIAWIAAVYIAWKFAEQIAHDYIQKIIEDPLISYLAAFGLLFLVVLFVIGLLNLIITQLLASTGLSGFDRFLGMLFGLARGLVIGALLVFIIKLTPMTQEIWWKKSRLAPPFAGIGEWGWNKLPSDIKKMLRSSGNNAAALGEQMQSSVRDSESAGATVGAERPENRASSNQRNAISDMGQSDIQLESFSAPDDENNSPTQNNSQPVLRLESAQ